MFRKTENSEMKLVTLELARQFAEMPALGGERKLREKRIKYLYNQLKASKFAGPNWAQVVDLKTGVTYRCNGNNSSNMLKRLSPEEFPVGLIATIDTYELEDMGTDGPALFSIFDSRASVRSVRDLLRNQIASYIDDPSMDDENHMMQVGSGIAFRLTQLVKAGRETTAKLKIESDRALKASGEPNAQRNALANAERAVLKHKRSQDETATLAGCITSYDKHGLYFTTGPTAENYRNFAKWLWYMKMDTRARYPWITGLQGVVAEILSNYIDKEEQAMIFWTLTFCENHRDVNHPSRELVRELLAIRASKVRRTQAELMKLANKHWKKFLHYREIPEAESGADYISALADYVGV